MAKLSRMNKNGTLGLNIPANKKGNLQEGDEVVIEPLGDVILVRKEVETETDTDVFEEIDKILAIKDTTLYKQLSAVLGTDGADEHIKTILKNKVAKLIVQL